MIPKIIHYCWFGRRELPSLAVKCIESWRRYLPDYEIREWNEDNFDVNIILYTEEAYRQGKYAFVSDYARFWILYRYGGIYFDTDVEIIRPMDDIIAKGNFMGFEVDPDGENTPGRYAPRHCFGVNPGLCMGIVKEHPTMKLMKELYEGVVFDGSKMSPWLKTVVAYTTEQLMKEGLQNVKGIQQVGDITLYPREYFAPINVVTGRLHITANTHTIHHYMGTWTVASERSVKDRLRNLLPEWLLILHNRYKRRKYKITE